MQNKFVDVASFQESSIDYFNKLKRQGAKFVFIKLTDGDDYVNPKASAQIQSALAVFGNFGIYHYWHGENAKFFISIAHHYGIDLTTTPIALDVEDDSLGDECSEGINHFEIQLRAVGVPKENIWTYGPASWFSTGRINADQLKFGFTWVASYGEYEPKCNAWQFTDGNGVQDWSIDYTGLLTDKKKKEVAPHYYQEGNHFEPRVAIKQYKDIHLKQPSGMIREKGYTIHGHIILDGKYPRIETPEKNYYTAKVDFVKRID